MTDSEKKHIVTIGGGTGTFVVLSGLKHLPDVTLQAIVSVADDGGSNGRLRDAYGFLPFGDARQALIALAKDDDTSLMRSLFGYRFSKGDVKGHNFGNLLLTALSDILGSGAEAIEAASDILRVRGRVVPVSEKPATLIAELENGETIVSEHLIDEKIRSRSPIVSLKTKEPVMISGDAKKAVQEADMIILGPGDLYTSTLANFAIAGLEEAVMNSSAHLVYIMNLFTKTGQTEGFGATRFVGEITRYAGRAPDTVVVHTETFPEEILKLYAAENEFPVLDDLPHTPSIVRGAFADVVIAKKIQGDALPRSLIRHDPEKIAEAIQKLL